MMMTFSKIQSSPDEWSSPWARRRSNPAMESYLLDPITAKERNIHQVPVDRLLEYSWLDKLAQNVKTTVYTLPKTVLKGLRGDRDFTATDQKLVETIPYYLSGAALVGAFVISGRKGLPAVRMSIGVGLYYAGAMAANLLVDGYYKARYGVDLGLRYQRADGRVEKVFGSVDAPRLDLLTSRHYKTIQEKMKIPSNLADLNQACREQIIRAISSAESLKLILGVLLAAVGAGQVARTNAWAVALNPNGALGKIWSDPKTGGVFNRLKLTLNRGNEFLESVFRERLLLKKTAPLIQKTALWGLLGFLGYGLYQSSKVVKVKRYEASPFQMPQYLPRGSQNLRSQSAFQEFIRQQNKSSLRIDAPRAEGGSFYDG